MFLAEVLVIGLVALSPTCGDYTNVLPLTSSKIKYPTFQVKPIDFTKCLWTYEMCRGVVVDCSGHGNASINHYTNMQLPSGKTQVTCRAVCGDGTIVMDASCTYATPDCCDGDGDGDKPGEPKPDCPNPTNPLCPDGPT